MVDKQKPLKSAVYPEGLADILIADHTSNPIISSFHATHFSSSGSHGKFGFGVACGFQHASSGRFVIEERPSLQAISPGEVLINETPPMSPSGWFGIVERLT